MNNARCQENQQPEDVQERKAALEAALEEEDRMSRRQVLLKKLWKLNQSRSEPRKDRTIKNPSG